MSPATVSRVFGSPDSVGDDTRARVLEQAARHGYKPRQYSRRGRAESCFQRVIGIVVPDISARFFGEVIKAAGAAAAEAGADIVVCDSDESAAREVRCLSLLAERGVDGIIITPVSAAAEYNAEVIRKTDAGGTPVVLLDRDLPSCLMPGVFLDNFKSAYEAVNVLIGNGHRRIAMLSGPTTSKPGVDRLNGYICALRDSGISLDRRYIAYGDFKERSARDLTCELLDGCPEITALVAANSVMGDGALGAINERGLSVPGDLAFISFGRTDAHNVSYIGRPASDMGRECAEILLNLIRLGDGRRKMPARRVSFAMQLELRGSEMFPPRRAGSFADDAGPAKQNNA